jgi:hypothetical protein
MQGMPHISVPIYGWRDPDASRTNLRPHRCASAFRRLSLSTLQTGSTRLRAKQLQICSKAYWRLKRSARPFAIAPGARASTSGPGASGNSRMLSKFKRNS